MDTNDIRTIPIEYLMTRSGYPIVSMCDNDNTHSQHCNKWDYPVALSYKDGPKECDVNLVFSTIEGKFLINSKEKYGLDIIVDEDKWNRHLADLAIDKMLE